MKESRRGVGARVGFTQDSAHCFSHVDWPLAPQPKADRKCVGEEPEWQTHEPGRDATARSAGSDARAKQHERQQLLAAVV